MTLLDLMAISPKTASSKTVGSKRPRCVDLFCGAGGFTEGAARAGCDVVLGADLCENAVASSVANGHAAVILDVRDVPSRVGRADLVIGGPPCQPYTGQGRREGRGDARDGFSTALDVVAELQPKRVVLENVRDFLAPRHAGYREEILQRMREIFEYVGYWVLDAKDFSVPQDRVRVFLWGAERRLTAPVPTHGGEVPYVTVRQALPGLGAPAIHVRSTGATSRSVDGPSPTVTGRATMYTSSRAGLAYRVDRAFGSTRAEEVAARVGQRALTWRELATLQGFDRDYAFVGTSTSCHQQVANAVPPPLATAVVKAVIAGM